MKTINITPIQFFILSSIVILGFSFIPLLFNFPYRINIFLAWEGAYRMSEGQLPFRDFGMPLGYGFWLVPALFFKIFGPYLFTLVKAQVFINIIAGFTFLNILRIFKVNAGIIFLSVLLFCLSFSFVNFWPWYNHMVFVYQLLSINFLLLGHFAVKRNYVAYFYLFLSAVFIFLSFFTKQDGGALAFMINFVLLVYLAFLEKDWKVIGAYFLSLAIIAGVIILPLLNYNFLYWFNLGQEPHSSRIRLMDILNNIFLGSQWIKFYLLIIAFIIASHWGDFKAFFLDKHKITYTLLVLGILVQALIVQTTSYIPHNVNIYFHSFAFAFIFSCLPFKIPFEKVSTTVLFVLLIFFWWSADYWNYSRSLLTRIFPSLNQQSENNSVSISNWITTADTVKTSRDDWKIYESKTFDKIYMPPSTIEGIKYLKSLPMVRNNSDLKVLNMSELTPLSHELGFEMEKGPNIPLWHHKNVAIFDDQIRDYCDKIKTGYYDIVLFEHINYLNNFYPDEIRQCLHEYYKFDRKFLAPREIQNSYIEIFMKDEIDQD